MARLRTFLAMAIGAALTASCGAQFKAAQHNGAPGTVGKSDSGNDGGGAGNGGGGAANAGGGSGGPY